MTNRADRRKAAKLGLVLPEGGLDLRLPNGTGEAVDPPRPRATLTVFAYAGLLPETADCIIRDIRMWPELQYTRMSADALIDRARCKAASLFLDTPREEAGDVLVMVDHDLSWQHLALEHLIHACGLTQGIVGGVYSKRQFGDGVAVRFAGQGTFTMGTDRVVPALYVSTGFMAIHRRVLEALAAREDMPRTLGNFYPFFLPAIGARAWAGQPEVYEYLSEDWAFCQRAVQSGFPIHADLFPVLHHTGDYAYRVVDGRLMLPPETPQTFVLGPDPTTRALGELLSDAAQYSEIAPDTLAAMSHQARQLLALSWAQDGGYEREAAWYARDDVGRAYVLDLSDWHMNSLVGVMEGALRGVTGRACLDFGAGIGTWSLMLADQGNEVDIVEPNGRLVDFMGYRAARMNLVPRIHQKEAPAGPYDLVVAWHVLEHLPDPQATAAALVASLAPGGLILSDSDFRVDIAHPMHHEDGHEKHGDDIWRAAGLEPAWEQAGVVHWWKRVGETAWRTGEAAEVQSDADTEADPRADGEVAGAVPVPRDA